MRSETSQIVSDPGTVDFGIGQPQLAILPQELMKRAAQAALGESDLSPLNYGHAQGDIRFREALAAFLAPAYGFEPDPKNILITSGASFALDLVASTWAQPGDTILVEEPTYFLAHQIFRDRGLKIVSVPLDSTGVNLEALQKAVEQHQPSLFYTIPAYQNPTGVVTSWETKTAVVELAKTSGFKVVADEVYQLLNFGPPAPPPYAQLIESEVVLSIGSFSKILAPGLRLGWIQSAPVVLQRFIDRGLFKSGGGVNHFMGCLVGKALASGDHARFTQHLQKVFSHRTNVMDRCLQHHLGDLVRYHKPQGGYFFWLELPPAIDAESLLGRAAELKTGFRPGVAFSVTGQFKNFIRLSFAHYDEEAIEIGVERLARVVKGKVV